MQEGSDQDRTEAPTPRRRKEAREEGNVARSQDLSAMLLLTGLLVLLWLLGPGILDSWRQIGLLMMSPDELSRFDVHELPQTLHTAAQHLVGGVGPLLLAVLVLAIISGLGQVGFLFSPRKLTPRLEALNPARGFGRIFASSTTWIGLVMNACKMLVAAGVTWLAIESELPRIAGLQSLEFLPAMGLGAWLVFSIGMKIAAVLLVLAMLDYAWQRHRHEQTLKMTRQQVKQEMKTMEGDPQVKARRRQIAMQRSMRRFRQDISTADLVVADPRHLAIAIRYDQATMRSPAVVAKGARLLALRIRELASANGVPIVERASLARSLYRTVEVGQEIPEDFHAAVAELLAYAYQLNAAVGAGSPE